MKKLFVAIAIVTLAACKKDHYIPEPAPEKVPPVVSDNGDNNADEEESLDSLFDITDIDLAGISFSPSALPLSFNSLAVGRLDANGNPVKRHVSNSGWTHPSVLKFREKWNGYNYWAAITPYPDTDSQFENPHIFCSNDGITWAEPPGILNPIEPVPPDRYNSDVNLLLVGKKLYCYWRKNSSDSRSIWVIKSEDGIHWGEKEQVCSWPPFSRDVISPSFVKDKGLYYCYGVCNYEQTPGNYYNTLSIRRMVSDDPVKGFTADPAKGYDLVHINGRPWGQDQDPWHLEVKKVANLWLMLVSTTDHNRYGGGGRLFLGYSSDGINFTFNSSPICNAPGSTYKSSFHAYINSKKNIIIIRLWRAMMTNGWSIYYDKFTVKINSIPIV